MADNKGSKYDWDTFLFPFAVGVAVVMVFGAIFSGLATAAFDDKCLKAGLLGHAHVSIRSNLLYCVKEISTNNYVVAVPLYDQSPQSTK